MTEAFRVVSYNVRYFGHALKGLASTVISKKAIAQGLAKLEHSPEIICLQEVETRSIRSTVAHPNGDHGKTQLQSFMAELRLAFSEAGKTSRYEALYFPAHTYRLRGVNVYTTGLAILIDVDAFEIVENNVATPERITHHHIQQVQVKGKKQTRICAHVRLVHRSGQVLHLFNTHLSLPTPFTKAFWTNKSKMGFGPNQVHEARTLSEFVKTHAGSEPFIVCGDFNSPPGSPVYRCLQDEIGWVPAQATLKQIDDRLPRAFPTAGFMRLRMHLDHLFSGNGVEWLDMKGTYPFGDSASLFHRLSDHVPLIARFRIKSAAEI